MSVEAFVNPAFRAQFDEQQKLGGHFDLQDEIQKVMNNQEGF